ncbi:autotransporter outer membrane beta-barrel domain-containing protein [Pseudomonas wuhanensis]|uniref:Autotransporter outer membrane beta-barrel domain-containing protein n=1 Tax=Pseudomonas wuhanensis TaxID=2954098 RepID=A0ABY9GZ77_9PSED|nr:MULTISPECIES: autotransporter outer membrane beta-barrel domain-containing protein [unclassified Pseudomonas]WLI15459.1 autotransporter outer membrane beta-barrel domain-containing protein [Pseudomonas sp. FP603]WLI21135.1 autotransporter outer membrane beta-barrel domain-containing protein [Pseudomonas sp. FP607]
MLCPSLLACFTSFATAAPVIGGNVTINGGTPESWDLSQNATLTVNGAQTLSITSDSSTLNVNTGGTTQQISASNGSSVNLSGATVSGIGGLAAVLLSNSDATIDNSTITGNRVGLQAVRNAATQTGSKVTVTGNSTITGVLGGALVSAYSTLDVTDSTIQGTGATSYGIRLRSGQATARSSTIVGGQNGVLIDLDPNDVQPAVLAIENTTVQGHSGSAILVDFANGATSTATISLSNSRLLAGNDTLLDVRGGANTSMTVNGSTLTGNIVTEQGSTTQLILQNDSVLTGRLENVASTTINDSSKWVLVDNSNVDKLTLNNGGAVIFGADNAFYQLNVTTLSGNGRFVMGTDFATGQTDLLNVTGTASGNHELLIASSGVDPAAGQPIRVVQTAAGDAQFSLVNGAVDLGTYSYGLAKSGNDWVLDPSTRTVSPGTRSVLALFNTASTVWLGELTSLRTRMGELRFNGGKAGAWGRTYANKYNIADGSGVGYQQTQQGFTLGADAPLPVGDGQWLVGVMAGQSKSDLDLKAGTSGRVASYYLGTYVTWLDSRTGYYFDGVLKANRFRNEAKVGLSDGARAKGDYDNSGLGGSIEFGRHISFANGNFLEPFTQWSAVVIQGKDFSLDNDLQAEGDRTRSFIGKVGATAGRNIPLEQGRVIQPYLRAAWAHEFAKSNEVQVNNNVFNNDLSGSRVELGTGVAVAMTKKLHMHADFDYGSGRNFEQPFGFNFGVRYEW